MEIRFIQRTWNAAANSYDPWTVPESISAVGADAVDAEMGVTNVNNGMQLHASWREFFCPVGEPCILRATYREWRSGLGWQPLVILSETTQVVDYAALAVNRLGRAAVAFVDDTCAGGHCAPLYYRQCDAAQTAGDCSDVAQWSATETVSVGTALAPDLSFDTSGVAHLAWYGFANGGKSIFYSARPADAAQWSAPLVLATVTNNNNLELYARIAAGTPNNVYLFWNDGVANPGAPTLYYRQWDGHAWADMRPLSENVTAYSPQWASAVVDANNVVHVAWQGKTDGIGYADAPQIVREMGRIRQNDLPSAEDPYRPVCILTEYYDTADHFRIYHTRTFPNASLDPNALDNHVEKDCSILEPTAIEDRGFHRFILELGDSLETSYAKYKTELGYPSNAIPTESDSGRYPIFILSNPTWTCDSIQWSEKCWISSSALTYPNGMMSFPQSTTGLFHADATRRIDWLRAAAAHEFFHAIQYTYYSQNCYLAGIPICAGGDRSWWMEATATWASRKVYPDCGWCADPKALIPAPYHALNRADGAVEYASFLFATHLEEQVAHNEAIIRQTWEQYSQNGGGEMITAIEQVLNKPEYNTNLRSEYPRFAWQNYFMNGDAYRTTMDVQLHEASDGAFRGPAWLLFRQYAARPNDLSYLDAVRKRQFPAIGPIDNEPTTIDHLGTAYFEFLPSNLNLPPNAGADLNLIEDSNKHCTNSVITI